MHDQICSVETLSAIPIVPSSHRRRIWRVPSETVNKVVYNYASTLNWPIIKNGIVFLVAFFKTLYWALRGGTKDKFIICDTLPVSISSAAMLAGKWVGVKRIAVVTDLPNFQVCGGPQHSLRRRIHNKISSTLGLNYDGYILLTEQMNKVVNARNMPYMIMEGLVDRKMAAAENQLKNKSPEKVIMYAGMIYEKYGVKKLIDAFMRVDGNDLRLHIYGFGEMENQMPDYMKKDPRIVYFGMVPNSEVTEKQLKATLLVNPRSSTEEFTKYSFPSKNVESMVSGTPLVTTLLPGMPQEYIPFVYLFDDESVGGLAQKFKTLLSKSKEELHGFGLRAKEFVLTHKNNKVQACRILTFLNNL